MSYGICFIKEILALPNIRDSFLWRLKYIKRIHHARTTLVHFEEQHHRYGHYTLPSNTTIQSLVTLEDKTQTKYLISWKCQYEFVRSWNTNY